MLRLDLAAVPIRLIAVGLRLNTVSLALHLGGTKRCVDTAHENTIELLAPAKRQQKQINRIVTDSRTPDDPKHPDVCTVVALLDAVR